MENREQMIKTVIFDFDGTIGDTFDLTLTSANEYAKEKGWKQLKIGPALRNKSALEVLNSYTDMTPLKLPAFIAELKKRVAKKLNTVSTFKGIKPVINKLKKKYKIGILTSNAEPTVRKVLKKAGISVSFIFSDSNLFGKHVVLKKLLRQKNLKPSEIIYVGDEVRDVKACNKVGVNMIAVTWGFNSKKALNKEKPTFLVDKPAEILKILR